MHAANEFDDRIVVQGASIDPGEFTFTHSRSSGPGGQNVNKVNTRVTLLFDVAASPSLSHDQKLRILQTLATRINRVGILKIVSSRERSQAANRDAVLARFRELIGLALRPRHKRVPTRVPAAEKRKRRTDKVHRARTKDLRRKPKTDD